MKEDQRQKNMSELVREVFAKVALAPGEAAKFLERETRQREAEETKLTAKRVDFDLEK